MQQETHLSSYRRKLSGWSTLQLIVLRQHFRDTLQLRAFPLREPRETPARRLVRVKLSAIEAELANRH